MGGDGIIIKTLKEILDKVKVINDEKIISVAAAQDEDVLSALKIVQEMKLAKPILVGDQEEIKRIADHIKFDISKINLIHESNPYLAAGKAVEIVREKEADILMKGMIGTSAFLKAVLEKEKGLVIENTLSHVALFETSLLPRLLIISDCAMNITPSLSDKIAIIKNSIAVANFLGNPLPKVAVVCAVETVNPHMQATIDAALLAKMGERGQIKGAVIDGPLALDNAISRESAKHKGIESPVAGEADILILPDIEGANVLYKALVYLSKTQNAGVIMGAAAPIVLTSRSDSTGTKLNSIALGLLMSRKRVV